MTPDRPTTRLAWELARVAYDLDTARAEQRVHELGFPNFDVIDRAGSTQAFACSDGERQFVAFRGTEANPVDWITDARFNPVAGAFGAPVHSGFKVALDEVWDDVAGLAGRPLSLFFTGHSLGAALATLGAARWAESGGNVAGVFTFGQPRTGQTAFVSAYNAKLADVTYRFVNHIDLVTRVPLWVQRYRHVGRRMYWDGSGRFHGDASWWQVAKDDIAYRFAHFGRIQSIGLEPHFVPAYSKLVDELQ